MWIVIFLLLLSLLGDNTMQQSKCSFPCCKRKEGVIWFRVTGLQGGERGDWGPGGTEGYHVIRRRKISDQGVIRVRNFPGDFFRI